MVKRRGVGDADHAAMIRAFAAGPRVVRRAACGAGPVPPVGPGPGTVARRRPARAGRRRVRHTSTTRPVCHDVIAASASSSAASPSSIVVLTGVPALGERTVARVLGDDAEIHFHFDASERLVAASGFGRASGFVKEMHVARMLVERRIDVTPAAVADAGVKLKSLVSAAGDR
ncbi:FAD-dependent pyridine nucleotide-disulfide oxidoreductase [Burkholderia cepacia GG4]|uniref:FAD-dependent pyridine nucleotide-disulfide oxidoreductase n=1 Tax=Burkholderia cepacia GG4 TaxID=1009846 RepID=A0A9W3P880_BURCE|nr:FAD-dependent pyridine nucleotide-disulfide oxidoreductase [Burkholderia cepacia GG4]